MKSKELELATRTKHLRPYVEAAIAFSNTTAWILPGWIHMAPLRVVAWQFRRHARDL